MATSLIGLAETHDFQKLFIAQLHWAAPDHAPVTIVGEDGTSRTATNVSSYAGIRVWVCPDRPGAKLEAQIDRALAKVSTDRIVIFHTADEQVWRWPVRRQTGQSVTARLTSHRHRNGQANPKFQARLNTITLPTDRILDANTVVAKVRAAFDVETQNETKHASQLMARMYAAMEKAYSTGTDPRQRDHDISLTLARVLFLMFGDDTEMWRTDAFRDFIHHHTAASSIGLTDQLDLLFTHLNTATPTGTESPDGFKYVNGGIFAEQIELPHLGNDFRDVILQACAVDWSTISPAIFGSMFQSVRDAETRRRLGEHYTSEENILKTLNPLFLDELRGDLAAALTRDTTTKQLNALNALWKRL
ncbi:MAG TPA: type IIL restriction-modification enzyme MmeI, partial [Propionibacteriaceae bacterium]